MALGKWFGGSTVPSIQYGTDYTPEEEAAFYEYLSDKDAATRQAAFKGIEQYYEPFNPDSAEAQQLKEQGMAEGLSEKAAEARVEYNWAGRM